MAAALDSVVVMRARQAPPNALPALRAAALWLALAALVGGEEAPWAYSFTTEVRGQERTFVTYAGRTWMLVEPADLVSGAADQLDVALTGTLRRAAGSLGVHRAPGVRLEGAPVAAAYDGDNLHLAGRLMVQDGVRRLLVEHALPAPTNAELLRRRWQGVAPEDWEGRLAIARWCREQAARQGDPDAWARLADETLRGLIDDLARQAGQRKDLALLVRAVDLALGELDDRGLAARLASPGWVREVGGPQADAIARRLRALGFAWYRDAWLPRPQALEREFEDRFERLSWRDADGFYRLGRWADEHAEELPRARERAWRCYQAGLAADPAHAGIRRELGLASPPRAGAAASDAGTEWRDASTGVRVPAPAGWRADGPGRWTHPESDTALIEVRVVPPAATGDAAVAAAAQWTVLEQEARQRSDFSELPAPLAAPPAGWRLWQLAGAWQDAHEARYRAVVQLAWEGGQGPLVVIVADAALGEQGLLEAALAELAAGVAR